MSAIRTDVSKHETCILSRHIERKKHTTPLPSIYTLLQTTPHSPSHFLVIIFTPSSLGCGQHPYEVPLDVIGLNLRRSDIANLPNLPI